MICFLKSAMECNAKETSALKSSIRGCSAKEQCNVKHFDGMLFIGVLGCAVLLSTLILKAHYY